MNTHGMFFDMTEQQTLPLNRQAVASVAALSDYLQHYEVEPLNASIVSKVRFLTVWKMQHGLPVAQEQADKVRQGLQRLTGVPYTGPIYVLPQAEQSH